jgi:hypothetical protein
MQRTGVLRACLGVMPARGPSGVGDSTFGARLAVELGEERSSSISKAADSIASDAELDAGN